MAGTEIANAYIALQVKMPGVKADIDKALGGSDVASVADKSGKSIGSRLASSAGKALKVSAVALGGILAAGIGTALVKGFQRLDAIDTARAKLTGLGNDAKTVDTIMANALTSVKGTAFGLGDAATVAAQAVAAGIKPGKDLEGVLGTVANTAAAAGTGLGEMGSIFSKAMTQANGVQNDVISQLADRGIPIYQALGKQLGVTAGEVFKLASEGKINFETFAAAATAASGTVASEMGGTWSGVFDNFMASLGRVGEGLLSGLFPQLKDGLSDVTSFLAPFEDGAKGVGEAIGRFVSDAGPKLVDTLKDIYGVGTNVVVWIKDNLTWLGPLVAAVGGAALAWGAWNLSISTWSNIVKAGTAIQAAFNAVMAANPIMLIVTAIAALVAGLVYFFTQTELGKAIWEEFTRFLGEAWANISGFFTEAWENVIQPVFQKIGEIATWLWENILSPVFSAIGEIVGWLAAAFKLQFDLIVNAFRLIGAIANWLWVNVLSPVFKAIGAIVAWVWNTFISPIFTAIGAALGVLGKAFSWIFANVIKPVWEGISSAIGTAWGWIDKNVFTPFKAGIGLIGTAFENIAKTIGTAWDGIKKAAAVPINFVLDTVWNNGLRSFWNDMVGTLGLDDMKLPKAKLVKFADGGVLPGYTPGRDVHEFTSPTGGRLALSGGEAIMRPEFTRAVGGAAGVAWLNSMARKGQAFADGGVWGQVGNFAGDVWDNIAGAASVAWEFLSNPAAAIQKHVVDGIINPLLSNVGGGVLGQAIGSLPGMLVKNMASMFEAAAPKSAGSKGMGWESMWQAVKANVPGAVMTSGYRSPSANAAANGAKGSYHMQGRAIDLVPASMATFNAVKSLFPNASELIYTPAGGAQLRNGQPFNGWSEKVRKQHYNHVHLAMAQGGVVPKLYDQGGWLPSGGMAVNKTGKPEAVLTPKQSEALVNGGLRDGSQLRLVVDGQEFRAYVELTADGRIDAHDSSMSRRLRQGSRF